LPSHQQVATPRGLSTPSFSSKHFIQLRFRPSNPFAQSLSRIYFRTSTQTHSLATFGSGRRLVGGFGLGYMPPPDALSPRSIRADKTRAIAVSGVPCMSLSHRRRLTASISRPEWQQQRDCNTNGHTGGETDSQPSQNLPIHASQSPVGNAHCSRIHWSPECQNFPVEIGRAHG